MSKQRMRRIGEEIKRIISHMLVEGQIKDTKVVEAGGLISVTEVDVVNDLKYAYVYISVLGASEKNVLEGLQRASGYVRKEIGRELSLRYTPEIVFRPDHSIEAGVHMSQVMKNLGLEGSLPSSEEIQDGDQEEIQNDNQGKKQDEHHGG